MKIALVGDSLTVGYSMYFEKLAVGHSVGLFAKVGASIQAMEQNLPSVSTALVMGGTNDLMGAAPSEVVARMERLVAKLKALGNRVIVGTIPVMRNGKSAESVEYNRRLLASAMDVTEIGNLVPAGEYTPDGVHLTAAGYRRLAAVWYDAVGRSPIARAGVADGGVGLGLLFGAAAAGAVVYLATRKG